jgi:hypothetical protein
MFSGTTFSAPVLYEYRVEVNSGQPLFSAGTVIYGGFMYDSESPIPGVPAPSWGAPYGDHSRYGAGVVSDFFGYIGGNTFGALDAEIVIADATPMDAYTRDGYFIDGGSKSHSGLPLYGFSIGDYTLVGFTFFGWGDETLYSSQDLPGELISGPSNGGIKLHFLDSSNTEVVVNAWRNESLTAVPLPAAFFPFASTILFAGLFDFLRNKRTVSG